MKTTHFKLRTQGLAGLLVFGMLLILANKGHAQSRTYTVESFNKVIVSPHIAVNFVQGNEESVVIESINEPIQKMNVEVVGKTLRLYLDGAKLVTKSERVEGENWKGKRAIYKGTIVTATVTYKTLEELSLRGEETFVCESPITLEKFRLKIYGESQVYLNDVDLDRLQTTIYGESYLELKEGRIGSQKITAYGETKVNMLGVSSATTKITAFGEGRYHIKVADRLKVTAYGEAMVAYEGNPEVDKGIILGKATIHKIN